MAARAAIEDFLAQRHLAIVGLSRDAKSFSHTVYNELRAHGYEVEGVNQWADSVEGEPCHRSVALLPDGVDGAIIMTGAEQAAGAVQECIDRGIPRVWLHKGVGASSVSAEAVERCRANGVSVIDGACPLMFLEPAGLVHRIHRAELRLTHRRPS